MSRQPMNSGLMHVQVRYVFISECIVCVCAHVFLGKFLSEWLMHLNYTPVWSNSLAKELEICKESAEVKNTIWFPSPEGHSSISLSVNIRGLKPWQGSQSPDAGRVQMQAELFVKGSFIAGGLMPRFCLTLQVLDKQRKGDGCADCWLSHFVHVLRVNWPLVPSASGWVS